MGNNRNQQRGQNSQQSSSQGDRRRPTSNQGSRPKPTGQSTQNSAREARPPQKKTSKRKKSKPVVKNRWFTAFLMVLAILGVCLMLALFVLRSASDFMGLNQPNNEYAVKIPENVELKDVADILSSIGVVDTPTTFRLYAMTKKTPPVFLQGEYTMNSNMSYDEILAIMRVGNIEQKTVTITFNENMTVDDIATLLEEEGVCDAKEFKDYMNEEEFSYWFIKERKKNPLRYNQLEGYLFPDTYQFFIGENVVTVTSKFLNNFDKKMSSSIRNQMEDMGLTLDEAITLASVIQQEAAHERDMVRVSSVFHNRLKNQDNFPNLQSDVTLLYAEKHIKPYLNTPNQEMLDAYNTYKCIGLPAGPVANPGAEAIYSTLNPIDTSYYYFVTDEEGKYYFAATLAGHNENIRTAEQAGEGHTVSGIGTRDPDAETN